MNIHGTACGTMGELAMGNIGKLLERAKISPQNITFHEACALAEAYGFKRREPNRTKSGSSHHVYKHPKIEHPHLVNLQPEGKKAKPYQVRQLLDYIEEYDLSEE
jgi:hypothetical protein